MANKLLINFTICTPSRSPPPPPLPPQATYEKLSFVVFVVGTIEDCIWGV